MNDLLINKIIGGAGDVVSDPKVADYKDNLYLAVNGAWQSKAVIPADKSDAGVSMDLILEIEKNLMQEFHDFAEDESKLKDKSILQAVKLYKLAKESGQSGEQAILKDLKQISDLKTIQDLSKNLASLAMKGFLLPINMWVDADMKDTVKNVVTVVGADLILPDKSYYDEKNESAKKLLATYAQVAKKLLEKLGYDQTDTEKLVSETLTFDKQLVPIVKSSEEWADYTKMYNPMDFAEFSSKSDSLDLKSFVTEQIQATPSKVIVAEPRYIDNLNNVVNESNFEAIKSWIIVRYLMENVEYVSEDYRQMVGEYRLAKSGAAQLPTRTKYAYNLASDTFDQPVGIYYGKKYFGPKARADVRSMIEKMIAIYKQRLTDNDWLSEATKEKAILKLDKIVLKVGYPDEIEAIYQKLTINENASLYENMQRISKISIQNMLERYPKPVDRNKWLMPGQMVNACYDPSRNDVTFPAAILQAPFYSLKQTSSENFGGIGAVIAHEISHAFDNNGAQFDEYGNMNNWWTEGDYAKFKQLTQKMIDEFDGVPYAGGKVNGTLVVSENIADVGGLRCAIEAAKSEPDYDAKKFFISWTKSWRDKATQQRADRLLASDPHSPEPLRANVMSQNLDEFYDAFGVTEKDGMWLDPDKRVNIW